jgi:hypothetical protein
LPLERACGVSLAQLSRCPLADTSCQCTAGGARAQRCRPSHAARGVRLLLLLRTRAGPSSGPWQGPFVCDVFPVTKVTPLRFRSAACLITSVHAECRPAQPRSHAAHGCWGSTGAGAKQSWRCTDCACCCGEHTDSRQWPCNKHAGARRRRRGWGGPCTSKRSFADRRTRRRRSERG